MKKKPVRRMGRRSFVKILPAGLAIPSLARQQPPATPQRISKEMEHTAEKLIGIELTDAQEAMALEGINRNLANYEGLRQIKIPLDTEPAISFHPALPGKEATRAARGNSGKPVAHRAKAPAYSNVEDLAFASLIELAELVRTRKVSPVELTRMYLDRLKRFGPKLLCVVTLTEELAISQAAEAEREIKAGKYRGPLHGIPWGAKDLFATKGIRTTWGAEPYRDQVINYDATVVERLRAAGAVLVAKLSMGALAQGGRWFGGMTRNPWQIDEAVIGSSGSSAGPASATSAGLVGFALGTETLGSIVSPSSRCGVVGLRPTYGRVSRYGAMGLSWTMDKIGPICRRAEDCGVVLEAIYGPDGRDLTVGVAPFTAPVPDEADLSKMRIGYLKGDFDRSREDQKPVFEAALAALRSAGARLEQVALPQFPAQNLRIILNAEAAAAFDDLTRDGGINQLSGQAPGDWPNSFRTSRFIPAVEYLRAQRARTLLMREMEAFMGQWDVFVSPAPGGAGLTITNLTGHPSVVLPCGFVNGLPQAITFTGGLYEEGVPLRAAMAFERATEWHTKHPALA
jgi:Asp-tRNA(Asn)/Glu-tRNA(Gln) amidotransferase A subunit family amidase